MIYLHFMTIDHISYRDYIMIHSVYYNNLILYAYGYALMIHLHNTLILR